MFVYLTTDWNKSEKNNDRDPSGHILLPAM